MAGVGEVLLLRVVVAERVVVVLGVVVGVCRSVFFG
jgi:hypothetical protein